MASIAPSRAALRDDRGFFFALAAAMAIINVLGFGTQYFMGRSSFGAPPLVHLHALVFMGWIGFFVFQTWLAASGQVRRHRRLGWLGAGWAALMVVIGVSTTVAMARAGHVPFFFLPAYFIVMNTLAVLTFAVLLWWGIAWRRRNEWHRRLVICAMTAIMGTAFGRLLPAPLMIPFTAWGMFAAMMLFPIVGAFYDWRRRGRVHPAWLAGALVLVGMQAMVDVIAITPAGAAIYRAVVAGSPGAAVAPYEYPPSRRWLDRSRRPGHLHGMDQPQNLKGVDIRAEIDRLRKERNAVILAHYYQKPEIQDLADFVGDSLDLSRKAQATDADVIAFCGVRFMAETAKILSPQKTVILPDMDAGCSLEDSCPPEQFAAFRAQHPDAIALTYINCSAAVKALSDVIVTSSSAEKILSQIPKDQKIIFGPDRNLGGYLARKTGRDLILWPGVCIVHEAFSETELLKLKAQHPDAPIAAHPECPPVILDHADYVGSTSGILAYAGEFSGDTLIVATEPHIIHQMEKALPGKTFIGAPGADGNCNCNICPYMALNTMEKLYVALRDLEPRIEMDEDLRLKAKKSLDAMLAMASNTVGQGDLGPARVTGD